LKQIIETSKTIDQVFENFKSSHFDNLGAIPYCSSYLYLDNGYGRSCDAYFSIEVKANQVIVSMLKKDIPYYWQWQFDQIFDEAIEKVKGALEIE
jgi:hypothetical protein